MRQVFEDLGFFIEYHVNNKYVGSITVIENDRDCIGYYSRKDSIADEDIKFTNNKVIKKGTQYHSYIYPLCGKTI
jgi:hypothetical protein